jgi:hypothetical protein
LEVVPAYLKGPASTWWTTNQALANNHANRIVAWTGNGNNTDFTISFPAAFRTETLIEIWTTELEQRRQQPGETVTDYASALQELYRRVETVAFQYPQALKARKFVNGLLPDLYVTVKPHNDQTWDGAVGRARQYELTHKDQSAVSAYLNKFTPGGYGNQDAQNEVLTKALTELTKQLQNFNTGNQSYQGYQQNNYRRRNYNNYNQSYQQSAQQPQQNAQPPKYTCYTCGQPGHISRVCPNRNNNVATQPSNNDPSIQSTSVNNSGVNANQVAQLQTLLAQMVSQNNGNQSLN